MKGINENNKDKYNRVELLNPEEKQTIINYYYQDSDEIRTETNALKIRRICRHCNSAKIGDSPYHQNFLKHINTIKGWQDEIILVKQRRNGPLDKTFHQISDTAKRYHSWIEWVIMTDRASTFVENEYNRKYAKMESICRNTYNKYVDLIHEQIKKKIEMELPETFLISFDGWSNDGEHYLCMFAIWTNKSGGITERLIGCAVQDLPAEDENVDEINNLFGFSSEDLGDILKRVLERYNRDYDSIEALASDNAEYNLKLANLIQEYLRREMGIVRVIALLGCASHRLNLAVKWFCSEDNNVEYERLIKKIHNLMVSLRTTKNRFKLSSRTPLCPEVEGDTRWDSIESMLDKALKLKSFLPLCPFDRATISLIPSQLEWGNLEELESHLLNFKVVSKWLQYGVTEQGERKEVNFATCRAAFNALIAMYPAEVGKKGIAHWLGPNAEIIHDKLFEKAVERIHAGENYNDLPTNLKSKLAIFKFGNENTIAVPSNSNSHFLSMALNEVENQRQQNLLHKGGIRSIRHLPRCNNICERLFSRTKLIMTDNRKSMDPSTLETIIMLRMNKDLWDERDVEVIIHKEKIRKEQETASASTAGNRRPRDEVDEDDSDNEDDYDSPQQTDITPLNLNARVRR